MRTPINTIEHASSFFDKETIIVKNVDKKAYLSALSISEFFSDYMRLNIDDFRSCFDG